MALLAVNSTKTLRYDTLMLHILPRNSQVSLGFQNVDPWKIVRVFDNNFCESGIPDQLKNAELTLIFHPP